MAIHKGTPMQLTRLVYASYHGGTTVKALGDILDQSQANNEVDGITGILVASDEDSQCRRHALACQVSPWCQR